MPSNIAAHLHGCCRISRSRPGPEVIDVTSKVGDQIKMMKRDHSFLFICVNFKIGKKVISTIMETMIFSSFLCSFAKY